MKNTILITLFMLALTISPAHAETHGAISVFSGSNTGVTIDAGTESLRLEIIQGDISGYSVKYSFPPLVSARVWFGAGQWAIDGTVSDNSSTWERTSFTNSHVQPVVFFEFDHDTGFFVRASHHEKKVSQSFVDLDNLGNVINQKTVSKKLKGNLLWVGYKLKF